MQVGRPATRRCRAGLVVSARLRGVEDLEKIHLDGHKRLQRELQLKPIDHSASCLGGSESFHFGPARGYVTGFGCSDVPWVAAAEIRREGDEFVRTRLLALTAKNSVVPHLDISVNTTLDGTMLRIDMIPKVDCVEDQAYLEFYYGEGRQALWENVTKSANAMYINPDVNARVLESSCCISAITRNNEKTIDLVSRAIFDSIDQWLYWVRSGYPAQGQQPSARIVSRHEDVHRLLYKIEHRSATETFLDRDFGSQFAAALIGPS